MEMNLGQSRLNGLPEGFHLQSQFPCFAKEIWLIAHLYYRHVCTWLRNVNLPSRDDGSLRLFQSMSTLHSNYTSTKAVGASPHPT